MRLTGVIGRFLGAVSQKQCTTVLAVGTVLTAGIAPIVLAVANVLIALAVRNVSIATTVGISTTVMTVAVSNQTISYA